MTRSSFTILVVDTRHRCLAPLGESLLGASLARRGPIGDVVIASAGTRPEAGLDRDAVAELTRRGVAVPEASVPRRLDAGAVRESGLVLTAARHQRARVVELEPAALRRTFSLAEMVHLAPRCGWPGPGGDLAADLAGLVCAAADARGLVPPDPAAAADLADPDGRGSRRVRRAARKLAVMTEELARLVTGSARSTGEVVVP